MQDATTFPPPACDVDTAPSVLTATVAGFDELQVKGTPVMVLPCVSSTVAVTVFAVPEVTLTILEAPSVTASAIDCTGQVMKSSGRLVALPLLTKREVFPGTLATT